MKRFLIFIKVSLVMALFMGAFVLPRSVHAADPDPPIILSEAHGFQCLQTTTAVTTADCDLLILIRYELPKVDWRAVDGSGNGKYMDEVACVDDDENNYLDVCYTSLFNGMADHSFYDGPQSSGVLQGLRTVPRVGIGLSGVYKAAGHGLTFGDTTYETCIEPSLTVFTPAAPTCSTITWHTVTDADGDGFVIDDARPINAAQFQSIAASLEADFPGRRNFFVNNTLITDAGAVFYVEAFTNSVAAAPAAFALSTSQPDSITSSTAKTALENAITTESTGTAATVAVSGLATNSGLSFQIVGGVIVGLVAGGLMIAILIFVPNGLFFALIVAAMVIWGGVQQDFVEASLVLVISLLLLGLGLLKWTRDNVVG